MDILEQINKFFIELRTKIWESLSINNKVRYTDEEVKTIESNLSEIEKILDEISKKIMVKKVSESYSNLLNNFLYNEQNALEVIKEKNINSIIASLLSDLEKISFLSSVSDVNNTVIIVGENGSGKSTYVNSLAGSGLSNLTVIPAQKFLYFDKRAYERQSYDIQKYQKNFLKSKNDDFKIDHSYSSDLVEKNVNPFSFMITALVNQVVQFSVNDRKNELNDRNETLWDQFEKIWKQMIPEISFNINSTERIISCVRDQNEYSINGLSDGEKCIIFYIGNVLMARENSFIVVDEPETYLNPAIYNKLWDILISEREDCQFIFTSHNVDFISSRINPTIVWCRRFIPPYTVDIRVLHLENGMPITLLTELIGSRRKILFCEGTKESYDYQIFSELFMNEYTVKPVGGHDKVIQYTKMFNELSSLIQNSAIGIVDQDGMERIQIESLKNTQVICLPYNEIEMLLLDKEVVKNVLSMYKEEKEVSDIFNIFKENVFKTNERNRNKIILTIAKNIIDGRIRNSFIDSTKITNKENLKTKLDSFSSEIKVNEIFSELEKKFDKVLMDKDYEGMLKLSTLKNELLKGDANKYVQSDYANCAIGRIKKDSNLQAYLKSKFKVNQLETKV